LGGYNALPATASGDDVQLLQLMADSGLGKVEFVFDPEHAVETATVGRFADFFQQRLRWVSKNKFSRRRGVQMVMAFSWLATATVPVLGIAALFRPELVPLWGWVLGWKFVTDAPVLAGAARFLGNLYLFRYYPVIQIIQTLYTTGVGLLALLPLKYRWKGRKVG
jgi:hypothetical protein